MNDDKRNTSIDFEANGKTNKERNFFGNFSTILIEWCYINYGMEITHKLLRIILKLTRKKKPIDDDDEMDMSEKYVDVRR